MTRGRGPVLAATDLDARSDRAIERAMSLAELWKVPLKVVHVIESGSELEREPARAEALVRAALPERAADAEILLATGSAPREIVETAQQAGCSVIVTGVGQYDQLGDFVTGTTVDHIVRHSSQPVLVAKQRTHGPYRTILVATDLSNCSRKALETAADLFADAAAIHLVHAYHLAYEGWVGTEENRDDLEQHVRREFDAFVAECNIAGAVRQKLRPVLDYGESTTVVVRAAERIVPDLVVLGTHGRSGFAHAVIGSTASHLLDALSTDTMMVRE